MVLHSYLYRSFPQRLVLLAGLCAALPLAPAAAAAHRHSRAPDAEPTVEHAPPSRPACTTPLTTGQHDPSVRNIRLQRQSTGAVVTMCLVSKAAVLLNPSGSIGLFARNGILVGTAAKAVPGKFQPVIGPNGGLRDGETLTIVPFTFELSADLPADLQTSAMVQLAWDSCPDEACSKPAEQSLALLLPIRIGSTAEPDRHAEPPRHDLARAAAHPAAPEKPSRPNQKPRTPSVVAAGTIY